MSGDSQPITSTPAARALEFIAEQHAGDTVLSLTFGREAAFDRACRFVLSMTDHALPNQQIDDFTVSSYCQPDTWNVPADAIAFMAFWDSDVAHDNVIECETPDLPSIPIRWCVLDWRVVDPSRIIPSTIIIPYPGRPKRRELELSDTDMLRVWFRQSNGELGVRIVESPDFDCLPDVDTRITASTLKVAFNWPNYGLNTRQITLPSRWSETRVNTKLRRLAVLVSSATRNAMKVYRRQGAGRTEWEDPRWRIGSQAGCISARDVILLGVVFVSSGRLMPLLQVRPEFVFATCAISIRKGPMYLPYM